MLKSGPIKALGMMSGTSLDGVDAAVLVTDGVDILEFGPVAYRPYAEEEQAVLRAALGSWRADDAAALVEAAHAEVAQGFDGIELVGFHGQTLAHDPGGQGTYQAGDGAQLADVLERPVAWDFRTADVAMGGQGAPLAPFFHWACARWIDAEEPVVFLNLGGVGNLTWVDPQSDRPDAQGVLLAFDTGPANAPLSDEMMRRRGVAMDEGGALARSGNVDAAVIGRFMEHPFFDRMPPKSLDRNDFSEVLDVAHLSDADAAATLTAAIAMSVAVGMELCPTQPSRVLVTGGGRKNATLMEMLQAAMRCPVQPVEEVGLDGDMLEAQAFAYLAVRVARGLSTSCPTTTGVPAVVGGGTLSEPH
ncbi:anhydro-N-acetylmuramic acid kinase [Shimia ponticola]|uniref:anhydro-N-acetylmuramic acid kinase n=1 Tax=Shimia ponticola TaxID=2582893 RepID=UPI0011BEE0F9|nr:anhydro-N-acetylmuramic acid kinase [Shimia ponticola]